MLNKTKFKRKKEKKSAKGLIVYLLIIAGLSLLGYVYKTFSAHLQEKLSHFELEDIHISGNTILSKNEILKSLGLKAGQKLLEISANDVVERLKKSSYIRAVSASYSLPSTLRITIHERKPVAFINGRGLNMIDKESFILPIPEKGLRWNLPVITGISEKLGVQGAETSSSKAKKAVEIIRYLEIIGMPLSEMVSEINLDRKGYIELALSGCSTRIRIDGDDYQTQLFIVSGYIKDYIDFNEIENIDYVDVRFNGQIIVRQKKA